MAKNDTPLTARRIRMSRGRVSVPPPAQVTVRFPSSAPASLTIPPGAIFATLHAGVPQANASVNEVTYVGYERQCIGYRLPNEDAPRTGPPWFTIPFRRTPETSPA